MCNKMSDVRLSNASPTLERVDARQPDNVRPPVSRNLFGSPDREGLRRYFDAAMQEDVQDFMDEYDFDPINERPLPSRRYHWQQISDAAEFYLRPPHGSQRPQRGVDHNGQDAEGSGERRPDRQPERDGSRKRRSVASGPCSNECQSKRSHTDEDDDDDEDKSNDSASQTVKAAEERRPGPENVAEVQ